jgi:hypothetical protein
MIKKKAVFGVVTKVVTVLRENTPKRPYARQKFEFFSRSTMQDADFIDKMSNHTVEKGVLKARNQ